MRRHQRCVLLIVGTLLRGLSAADAASYTFTTIDVPGALHTNAAGINDRGHGRRRHGPAGLSLLPRDLYPGECA
jgi:hypothetical protein